MKRPFSPLLLISLLACLWSNARAEKRGASTRLACTYQNSRPVTISELDSLARAIKMTYKDDASRLKAAYVWVTSTISYDVDKLYSVQFTKKEDQETITAITLATKRGVCSDYVAVLRAIADRLGLTSHEVVGYTRQHDQLDYVPHAWCVIQVNSVWQLFDPTWDAGHVQNNRFYQRPSLTFFACNPQVFLQTHMPFDPIWQLLSTPMSYSFFDNAKPTPIPTQKPVDYNQFIIAYSKLDSLDQLITTTDRIRSQSPLNSIVAHYLSIAEFNIVQLNHAKISQSSVYFNEAVNHYNLFISFLNKQFKPTLPDSTLDAMLKRPIQLCRQAREGLAGIKRPTNEVAANQKELVKAIDGLDINLRKYDAWLAVYLTKSKIGRVIWFTKLSAD
ncbi:Kyphoscoliosis peptidase [Fibrella aestuarina BUZ 2]|uniref:Kyphoscoliosis peptidase n=1 Tax=Fibrella aestuarina BUZ 2 TaxID=1166018 RepID=I0KB16_9BACT|nr:transglutaminase domain-containing protein [Fibrella aestuarina]CCH01319.1 Kyphoscoliosis peptidase [Fibrella aestuarina BUZ 2]